ncbi:MAG: hypothetical protein ACI4JE_04560 [Ruminococcus sp.]
MIRISAEFESPELAELAIKRVKNTVKGIHSSNIIYNKISDKAMKLRSGNIYTIIPTAVTTHNYITAVVESPASEDVITEPNRSRKTYACIFCDGDSAANVRALFSAMGGTKVSNPKE